jgi:hypothetical protein
MFVFPISQDVRPPVHSMGDLESHRNPLPFLVGVGIPHE